MWKKGACATTNPNTLPTLITLITLMATDETQTRHEHIRTKQVEPRINVHAAQCQVNIVVVATVEAYVI
jgi:hypothetical protein